MNIIEYQFTNSSLIVAMIVLYKMVSVMIVTICYHCAITSQDPCYLENMKGSLQWLYNVVKNIVSAICDRIEQCLVVNVI